VLGFNRVPPTVGRIFNITRDFWEKTDPIFAKTFFYSPVGNTCFTGHCSYYCDTTHAICGKPEDHLEGSTQLMLPRKPFINWLVTKHPFKRSYNKKKQAEWEKNENYCEEKVLQKVYYQSKNILDLIDMSIFDFIIGNMDRHHFEKLISLGNDTFSLHLDNGRAFGKPHVDELSILAPLTQCCLFRYSTYSRLRQLYFHDFSKLLDKSLKQDPLYPILTQAHLVAVDRRLIRVFLELEKCLNKHALVTDVLIDDGY
jgi:extracellular serine/threonine protein kinase FAM20C